LDFSLSAFPFPCARPQSFKTAGDPRKIQPVYRYCPPLSSHIPVAEQRGVLYWAEMKINCMALLQNLQIESASLI
jgi:hypothetical protein